MANQNSDRESSFRIDPSHTTHSVDDEIIHLDENGVVPSWLVSLKDPLLANLIRPSPEHCHNSVINNTIPHGAIDDKSISQIDHSPHSTTMTSERFDPASSHETDFQEEFPFDDTLFTPESTDSIHMSHINIVDASLNETPPDDGPPNFQDDALINDGAITSNSLENHHPKLVIHHPTKEFGIEFCFNSPLRFDPGWHHLCDPIFPDNQIMTRIENHDNIQEVPINYDAMNRYDEMTDNDHVILPTPPLESKLHTFEDDSQFNYDHLDPCRPVQKVDLSMVRNDIQGITVFTQNLEGDEETISPFTHPPFVPDERGENVSHDFNLNHVDEDISSIFKVSQPICDPYHKHSSEDGNQLDEAIRFENDSLVANEVTSHNASVEISLPKPSLVHNDVRHNTQREPNICTIMSNDRILNPRQKTFPKDDKFSIREPFPCQSICEPHVIFGFVKVSNYAKNATDSIGKGTKHNTFNDDADRKDDYPLNPNYELHPLTVRHASIFDNIDCDRSFVDFIWQSWIEHGDSVIRANQTWLCLHLRTLPSSYNQFQSRVTKPFITVATYSTQSVDRSYSRNENDNPIDVTQYPKNHPP